MDRVTGTRVSAFEALAMFYLVAPVFSFFVFFVSTGLAISGCLLILIWAYRLVRVTEWLELREVGWAECYFAVIALMWIVLSGGVSNFYQNIDWWKHYAVLN